MVSTLHSAIDQLATVGAGELHAEELDAEIVELHRAEQRIAALKLARIAEAERRRSFEILGYLSAGSWLADRLRLAHGAACSLVGLARALRSMPGARDAFGSGLIDLPRVRTLAEARRLNPEAYAEGEDTLVDAALTVPAHRFRSVVEYWKQAADMRRWEAGQEALFERRRAYAAAHWEGMVHADADLDPEGGQVVLTVFRAHVDRAALDPNDHRTAAQVRADVLVDLFRDHLDAADLPRNGGERPHLNVVVDVQALAGRAGRAELDDTGPITPEAARRIACDAAVSRVVMQGPSEVLDVGRRTRTIPAGVRRALVLRDRGCTAEGCDRPPGWCDAHHIVHWADGGSTSLENLRLLCRRHHRLAHHAARRDTDRPRGP